MVRRTTDDFFANGDLMAGTMSFGVESSHRMAASFGIDFSTRVYDEVLFMTADCSKWVLTNHASLANGWVGNGVDQLGNGKLDIISSSENSRSHQITVQEKLNDRIG